MWRHGSRTPVNCNWNCEYFLYNDLLNGFLTPTGMRQHFVLGQWMRQRYITELQFLSDTYDASQILVYSTDVNRTIMSAMSNLQGMYSNNGPKVPNVKDSYLIPPNPGAETPTDIGQSAIQHDIQILPIHMREAITDDRLLSILICPKGYEMFVQNMQTNLTISVMIKAQSTLLQFCNEMNIDPLEFNIFTLTEYMDTFYSCIYNDYPMPPNLTKETYLKVDSLYALTIALQLYQTKHQVDVFSSPFFESLLSYFDTALTQQETDKSQKYIIYSAHDINVQLIASALNFTSAECMAQVYLGQEVSNKNCIYTYPGFASNIIWELWEEEQTHDHYIKVLYNGTEMNICNTDSKKCSYKIFKQLIENQRRDFEKECSVEIDPIIEEKVPIWMITLSIIFLFILFAMILYILCLCKKLRANGKTKLNEDKEP
ncbi:unnamed protein product (macronuclear) [Paramecium tetraurelia]|uniref:Histidine acid phosphatase n=1 Tax=Paramecium tetraurelia TaxID=5888 RepID=A0DKS0_PARTE|nr:uncharacterized protein GSPATT00017967001 [Paramecium tetraurelia]CAK83637.1 unnamed protein product [Paramecium tetraurelia]|eukprot:XP_001451034.1 hypothetical protein (macronuclear) [Paramecium tetraurelia strain d4-2]